MTDLLIPILIILVMLLIIDYLDVAYPLMLIGFLFIPISWLYSYQISADLYDTLFNADISSFTGNIPSLKTTLSVLMWFVPILAFLRAYFVKYLLNRIQNE